MDGQRSIWPYIKGYKFNSLLVKNFIYVFVLVTLPLLLVLTLNYKKFDTVVNSRVLDMNEELLQKNAVVTDNIMVNLLGSLNQLSQLPAVMEIAQTVQTDDAFHAKAEEVAELVKTQTANNNLVASGFIYSDANEMLVDAQGATPIDQIGEKGKWYEIHKRDPMVLPYILVNNSNSVYVCQPIWSMKGQRVGLFVLDVELQKIRQLLEDQEVSQDGTFFIIDLTGQVIYCNESNYAKWDAEIRSAYEEDIAAVATGQSQFSATHGKRVVSVADSTHKSWKYALVTEQPDYKEELDAVYTFLLSSVLVGIVTSIIVAYVITVFTYRPMRKIMDVINNPQLHWNEREATKSSNELLYITSNILADRNANKEISEELEERIRALRQAQFRALQFQIDPHFLYNTLETIKWNAVEEMGLGNKTSKMLTKVARLYRLGLENDDVIVSLKEELDFLKLYIEIVRIRFGESIQFHWNIDESLYDCTIIKMCLQPIVENAIQHGLRPKNYLGNITVSAYREKDVLCVTVEDDGRSMGEADRKRLNEKLKTGAGFEESKVGLRNVNERIKLIYGKKYGVSISGIRSEKETSETGVRVMLTFPCRNFYRSEETK